MAKGTTSTPVWTWAWARYPHLLVASPQVTYMPLTHGSCTESRVKTGAPWVPGPKLKPESSQKVKRQFLARERYGKFYRKVQANCARRCQAPEPRAKLHSAQQTKTVSMGVNSGLDVAGLYVRHLPMPLTWLDWADPSS